ncbi:ATP-binding protein [Neobacillus muris]|uniref:ATP-binding protein n=1 Tax=Neobacillus muris TaxID=2941334 RepID=UPI00203BB856|nr:ATP-binding protein [Neobacillus muris]
MADFIKDLILHFFIMMLIPLTYILLSRQKKELNFQIIFESVLLITLYLTMFFPVYIGNGAEFDLKFIPIFISLIYGGPLLGFIAILALLIMELSVHGAQGFIMLINYTIIMLPLLLVRKWYLRTSMQKKMAVAFCCYLAITITRFIFLINIERNDLFVYLLLFSIVSFLSLGFTIYLIETNDRQLYMIQQLQNAEKLNSISQLAASVAHEIRNPMTTIRGFMQLLKDEENLTANQQLFVKISLEELNRTQAIIDDFLSLARPNKNECQLINISLLLKEAIEFMKPYGTISGVQISAKVTDDLYINGYQHEFKQLMINLMKNGIEAMPNGGELSVIACSDPKSHVVMIKDEGIGISETQLKQLGQPYYSTKTRGTGLGLLISYNIAKRMQGKIIIDSKVNVGTVFTLTFPKKSLPS